MQKPPLSVTKEDLFVYSTISCSVVVASSVIGSVVASVVGSVVGSVVDSIVDSSVMGFVVEVVDCGFGFVLFELVPPVYFLVVVVVEEEVSSVSLSVSVAVSSSVSVVVVVPVVNDTSAYFVYSGPRLPQAVKTIAITSIKTKTSAFFITISPLQILYISIHLNNFKFIAMQNFFWCNNTTTI